ncbi:MULTISPECIES: class I SAM-dependent methyltransferase [unclassified Brucella]|uniref:class I SAM-dependent methyltransferase n=1 Tax=unclassified Brucella TaxID=2632610 RepID=UPI0031B83AF5
MAGFGRFATNWEIHIATDKLAKAFGRQAFGKNPAGYHGARPEYPEWVYDTLASRCGLRRNAAVFEIGAGTGTATHRLLELGADPLVAIEPDPRLASFLRMNNPDKALKVVVAPFENVALEAATFDLGVSATAFHWLDEESALVKIANLLRPGGWWAALWNVFGDDSRPDPFHEATKELLAAPESPSVGDRGIPFALDATARLMALNRSGAFDFIDNIVRGWSLVLDAKQTVALYATYSNVNARSDCKAVLAELGRIAREDFGNSVVRNMITSLYIARRRTDES